MTAKLVCTVVAGRKTATELLAKNTHYRATIIRDLVLRSDGKMHHQLFTFKDFKGKKEAEEFVKQNSKTGLMSDGRPYTLHGNVQKIRLVPPPLPQRWLS